MGLGGDSSAGNMDSFQELETWSLFNNSGPGVCSTPATRVQQYLCYLLERQLEESITVTVLVSLQQV